MDASSIHWDMNAYETDPALDAVRAAILNLDPVGLRTGQVLRNSMDQIYDGQKTGRYRWNQLRKTERLHFGRLFEINLHREFQFQDGVDLDYRIAGFDVDCKYSQTLNAWMIPPEAREKLCLLVWAEDQTSQWRMGLVRARAEHLNTGGNRDQKSTLNAAGREAITWIFPNQPLSPNVLLQLDRAIVDKIMGMQSGQNRVNELFRYTLGMRVGRGVVATVAQQNDYMKRVRGNGGARTALQSEGIIILGQYRSHRFIAQALGENEPGPGESIPLRIVPAKGKGRGAVAIGSGFWRVAKKSDPVVPAPRLPSISPGV